MTALKILFIGGTGKISSASVRRAVADGHHVAVLNRGSTAERPLPDGVEPIVGDIRDAAGVRAALAGRGFDVVADFVAFTAEDVQADIDLFRDTIGQYLFISSASVYQTPAGRLPITESTPRSNPFWQYARDKLAAEEVLNTAYREQGFPVTIVRPAHTYDRTMVPLLGGWTAIDRMRRDRPVLVHGDGSSLWTITHHADFAKAFVGLLGRPDTIGDSFHITNDEWLTWDQITTHLATAAGVTPRLVHVTSDSIAAAAPRWAGQLLGDMAHSSIFDNSKVKAALPGFLATIPFSVGAREIIEWFDGDPARQVVDPDDDKAFDALIAAAGAGPTS